ncbi:3191_t:CDS:2, partial [Acaulospora colombiana]
EMLARRVCRRWILESGTLIWVGGGVRPLQPPPQRGLSSIGWVVVTHQDEPELNFVSIKSLATSSRPASSPSLGCNTGSMRGELIHLHPRVSRLMMRFDQARLRVPFLESASNTWKANADKFLQPGSSGVSHRVEQ